MTCHQPDCPTCRAEDEYRRGMARIYNENCDMCRHNGIDRKMTHWDDRYGNMCDEHFQANKTQCPQGHKYTPENTDVRTYDRRIYRYCKQCQWDRGHRAAV